VNNVTSTYAGVMQVSGANNGAAQTATFNGATSISFNSDKSALFIGDAYNQLIRKIYSENIGTPIISFTNDNSNTIEVCQNSDVSIDVSDNFSFYEIYLDNVLTSTTTSSTTTFNFLLSGSHSVEVRGVKPGYTPTISNQLTVEVIPNNTFDLIASPSEDLCVGDSAVLATSDLTQVTWNTGEIGNEITVKNDGDYFVTAILDQCLTKKDTVSINFHPYPIPAVIKSSNGPYYFGDSLYLSVSGGSSYLWSNQITGNQILVKTSGDYSVEVDNGYGCVTTSELTSINFEVRPFVLSISTPNGNFYCAGDSLEIYASESDSISWFLNGLLMEGITSDTLIVKNEGAYTFSYITPLNDTVYSGEKYIYENELPIIDFNHKVTSVNTNYVSVDFTPTNKNGLLYEWDINELLISENINLSYDFTSDGNYTVNLTMSNIEGCSNTISKEIEIILDEPLFVPTGFSPNYDGLNDVVYVRGVSANATINFMIFNEWGQLVFSSTDVNEGWDGSFNGQMANMGNYSYILQVRKYGITKNMDGIITLIQ